MPFQPIPENKSSKPQSSDLALLLIRILAVLAFLYYQLGNQLNLARLYLWEKAEWSLVGSITDLGLPVPGVIAMSAVMLLTIALLGITLGILTRINGIVAFVLIGFAFFLPLEVSKALSPQTLLLYLVIFLGLGLGGAGRLSLDQIFSQRKKNKK